MREVFADAFDGGIGGGLDVFFDALGFVFGQFGFFDRFHDVAADIAHVDAAFFGEAVGVFNEFEAAFLAHVGERNADDFAVGDRVEAEVGFLDAADDVFDDAGVPRLNLDEAGVGRADGRALFERGHGAVGFDHDGLDHLGRGFAGVDGAKFVERVVHGFFHLGLGFGEERGGHGGILKKWKNRRRVGSVFDEGADFFAESGFADGVFVVEVEHEDRNVVVETEGKRGGVHDVEALFEGVDERDLVVFDGVGEFFRVFIVDAVDLGGFHDDVGVHLGGAEGGGGIGREVRIAGAGGEDDDAAFFEVAHGATQNERLGDLVHRNGALDARGDAHFFEAIHEREGVDDGGEHAHVIARGPVDAALGALEAAEDVAAADDDADFDAEVGDLFNLAAGFFEGRGVDGIAAFAATQDFARKL